MKFSIIIVNNMTVRDITRTLDSIAAQTQTDFEVLVVGKQTTLYDQRFRFIDLPTATTNSAKNQAAVIAQGEWLFFLSPHTILHEECLAALYACSLRFLDCTMFAPTQLEDANPDIIDAAGKCYSFFGMPYCGGKGWPIDVLPDEGEVFGACSPAIFIRKDVFDALGGFDEDLECCLEDADLAFRLRLAGHYAMLAPEAMTWITSHPDTPATHRHAMQNIITVFVKNMPDVLFWPLLPFHLCALIFLLFNPKHYLSRVEGFVAAFANLPAIWRKRRAIQRTRKVTIKILAQAFVWDLNSLFWRRSYIHKAR